MLQKLKTYANHLIPMDKRKLYKSGRVILYLPREPKQIIFKSATKVENATNATEVKNKHKASNSNC